jgi:4-amino-4-deoxy-L-arabinose transferase-like glycosyltransferase
VAVLAAAFALRAAWALSRPAGFEFFDSRRYHNVAVSLVSGRGFVLNSAYPFLAREHRGRGYAAHSDPGYSVFLAGLYAVGLDSARAVRLVQVLLGTATVWLVMLLALRLFGRTTALAAGAVAAFEPHLVFFTGLVLTETLFTFLLAASLLVFIQSRSPEPDERPLARAAAWGALSGAAALVRSTFLLFLPLAAALDVALAERTERRARLVRQLVALAVYCAVLAPWTIRNAARLGAFVPGTTCSGVALYESCGPDAFGGWDSRRHDWPEEDLAPLGEIERDRYLRRAALRNVLAHPGSSAALAFVKLARLWSPVPWAPSYRTAFYWAVGILAFALLVVAAGAGG